MKVKKFVKTQYNKKQKKKEKKRKEKKRKRQMVHKNAKIENCSGLTAISRDISFLNFYLLHTKDERKENAI